MVFDAGWGFLAGASLVLVFIGLALFEVWQGSRGVSGNKKGPVWDLGMRPFAALILDQSVRGRRVTTSCLLMMAMKMEKD